MDLDSYGWLPLPPFFSRGFHQILEIFARDQFISEAASAVLKYIYTQSIYPYNTSTLFEKVCV